MSPTRFVLVRPRSPGNVGSTARAMKNFGLEELVLVDPRLHRHGDQPGQEPYFESESRRMAWHAADLLERSRHVATVNEALEGCALAFATAPQSAGRLASVTPEEAATALAALPPDAPGALLFGSESSGLTNEEAARCAGVVVIPTDPAYRDLNLAQSVAVMAYICFRARRDLQKLDGVRLPPERAAHEFVEGTADAMMEVAARTGFLSGGGGPVSRELRHWLHRTGLTRREAELLRSLWNRILASLGRDREAGGEGP